MLPVFWTNTFRIAFSRNTVNVNNWLVIEMGVFACDDYIAPAQVDDIEPSLHHAIAFGDGKIKHITWGRLKLKISLPQFYKRHIGIYEPPFDARFFPVFFCHSYLPWKAGRKHYYSPSENWVQ